MPPPIDHPCLHLHVLPDLFFVCKLEPNGPIPQSILNLLIEDSRFLSLTRTPEEISISGQWHDGIPEVFKPKAVWRCIKLRGPMEFSLVGVLAQLTTPLREAGISVFVISTWNTDYLLVDEGSLELTMQTLKADGWIFAL
ncbi:ACT domain-containing protein [Lentinula raphanica]|uniref:ACT domain-containing protein n=1 Tax=Lentinula raphanica TaxID=153919 RepID=A0AA38UKT6_9AGAR|nr:ACT domain-containing protein [Lentinula raphanica]KAJ3844919.1 ACT domain-containing protein [Lentinula raphanica]KAJ3977912.1 ACT domain-containing protein [Lentinula raphanica]